MSLYAVLVAETFTYKPDSSDPVLPNVVAHNLTREEAERMHRQMEHDSVGSVPTGWRGVQYQYEEAHPDVEPSECPRCMELVLAHCKRVLHMLEDEKKRRGKSA